MSRVVQVQIRWDDGTYVDLNDNDIQRMLKAAEGVEELNRAIDVARRLAQLKEARR